jgi:glycolate oxidase FAD binding subunit
MTIFRPADAAEAAQVIAWAAAEGQSLAVEGGGSKRTLGRAAPADHALELGRLSGILDYDAPELVLTARAATPMAEIEAALRADRQMLAFEPPDWRGLLGSTGAPTLGGVIACNLAGPRRVRAGAARDHFLGFSAINGSGEIWKAGGRVVKNVTGYDLCKLQCGAYGTLSVLTELTIRVVPLPETSCTLLLAVETEAAAIALLSDALNTPFEVSAAASLPRPIARRSRVAAVAQTLRGAALLRLEGWSPSVAYRVRALTERFGDAILLDADETARLWAEIGEVHDLLPPAGRCIWRIAVTPAAAASLAQAFRLGFDSAELYHDGGGGTVWLSLDEDEAGEDGGAGRIRAALRPLGGNAMLIVGSAALRAGVPVFEPVAPPLARLSERVRHRFDPRRVLNPGRMQAKD